MNRDDELGGLCTPHQHPVDLMDSLVTDTVDAGKHVPELSRQIDLPTRNPGEAAKQDKQEDAQ